jgi:hypothetical protein
LGIQDAATRDATIDHIQALVQIYVSNESRAAKSQEPTAGEKRDAVRKLLRALQQVRDSLTGTVGYSILDVAPSIRRLEGGRGTEAPDLRLAIEYWIARIEPVALADVPRGAGKPDETIGFLACNLRFVYEQTTGKRATVAFNETKQKLSPFLAFLSLCLDGYRPSYADDAFRKNVSNGIDRYLSQLAKQKIKFRPMYFLY